LSLRVLTADIILFFYFRNNIGSCIIFHCNPFSERQCSEGFYIMEGRISGLLQEAINSLFQRHNHLTKFSQVKNIITKSFKTQVLSIVRQCEKGTVESHALFRNTH
jgi:hypothetical protein